jgi:hypothetical protein
MKILEFLKKYMGKFLTSWSRSRTKMDRLRNTGENNQTADLEDDTHRLDDENVLGREGGVLHV